MRFCLAIKLDIITSAVKAACASSTFLSVSYSPLVVEGQEPESFINFYNTWLNKRKGTQIARDTTHTHIHSCVLSLLCDVLLPYDLLLSQIRCGHTQHIDNTNLEVFKIKLVQKSFQNTWFSLVKNSGGVCTEGEYVTVHFTKDLGLAFPLPPFLASGKRVQVEPGSLSFSCSWLSGLCFGVPESVRSDKEAEVEALFFLWGTVQPVLSAD